MDLNKVEQPKGMIDNNITIAVNDDMNDVAVAIEDGVKTGINDVMGATADVITSSLTPDTAHKLEDAGNLLGTVIKGAEGPIKESLTVATDVANKEGPKLVHNVVKSMVEAAKALPGPGSVLAAITAAKAGVETAESGLNMINAFTDAGKVIAEKVTDAVEHTPNINDSIPTNQLPIPTNQLPIPTNEDTIPKSIGQSGGRRTRRERKQMERRINKSLASFYNPLSIKTKTKKVRRGTKKRRRK